MDLELKGHNVLITGGTKGIGRAMADTFAEEGANVAICARNQEEIDAAVKALEAHGVKAFGQSVDVGSAESISGWIEASAAALGGIDTVVHNVSGGNAPGEEGWRANFEYDMLGAVRLVEGSMPYLEKSSNASVTMISTTAALEKFIAAGSYNAMKAAVLQYAGAIAQDVAPKGIRVNSVSPGPIFVEGGSWDRIKQNMTPFYDQILGEIPLGRMGTAREVAAQVVLMASPRGGFTTATNVVIDGGLTKRIQF